MINKRASANHVISQVMNNANGIGQSKSNARNSSGVKGQNGHSISTKAHSISSTQNLRTMTTQYINHLKENYGNKVVEHITNDTVKEFIDNKWSEVSGGTLNTYISELGKMADNLNQLGVNTINREAITDYREELKQAGNSLRPEHTNRAYNNPHEIVHNMQDTPFGLSAQLQVEAGLRADDAINSDKWTVNDDNTLTIHGSKNGLDYTTTVLSAETIERVQDAIENGYKCSYEEYRQLIIEAGADNGSHGLRYNFAQERVEELREHGMSYPEALAQTSLEMGHSREEITLHYLAK